MQTICKSHHIWYYCTKQKMSCKYSNSQYYGNHSGNLCATKNWKHKTALWSSAEFNLHLPMKLSSSTLHSFSISMKFIVTLITTNTITNIVMAKTQTLHKCNTGLLQPSLCAPWHIIRGIIAALKKHYFEIAQLSCGFTGSLEYQHNQLVWWWEEIS